MNVRAIVFIGLGVVLLSGLFLWFRPSPEPVSSQSPQAALTHAVEFQVRGGERIAGPPVVRVPRGTTVRLTVSADRDDELHLHGYDRTLALEAGEPATLTVSARQAGRFELELHADHTLVTVLEVRPH